MPDIGGAFREALADGDVERCRCLWGAVYPYLPQPRDRAEAEVAMHQARTAADSLPLAKRLYSHAWLTERAMRSELPRNLRPPRIVPAVGISVNTLSHDADLIERAATIERAMSQAAGEAMTDGVTDPEIVSAQMWAARARVLRL